MKLAYKEYKWLLIVFLIPIIIFSYFIYRDFKDEQFQKEYKQFIEKDIIPSISGLKPLDRWNKILINSTKFYYLHIFYILFRYTPTVSIILLRKLGVYI